MSILTTISPQLVSGPVALIVNEDDVGLARAVEHHAKIGFPNIVVIGGAPQKLPNTVISVPIQGTIAASDVANALMDTLAGRWILLCYNCEFFYYPFFETRTIQDVVQFSEEEKRDAIFSITVDLYTQTSTELAQGDVPERGFFDPVGYYSETRYDGPAQLDRQIAVYGGLKWRFAEHIPWQRRSIDRIALFKAKLGLRFDDLGRLSDSEMNTISCPWHNNITAAVASWRVSKSLARNPGSMFDVEQFAWPRSQPFEGTSDQLMRLGLMEPGQWF